MEDSTNSPSINMIPFPTRTILDGEIIPTYVMGTHLNKAIKAKYSLLGEANGASSFKCREIESTNAWKIASQALNPKDNVSAIML
jgi:hypothetical protein